MTSAENKAEKERERESETKRREKTVRETSSVNEASVWWMRKIVSAGGYKKNYKKLWIISSAGLVFYVFNIFGWLFFIASLRFAAMFFQYNKHKFFVVVV